MHGNRTLDRPLSRDSIDLGLTCTTQHQSSEVGIATTNLYFARWKISRKLEILEEGTGRRHESRDIFFNNSMVSFQ